MTAVPHWICAKSYLFAYTVSQREICNQVSSYGLIDVSPRIYECIPALQIVLMHVILDIALPPQYQFKTSTIDHTCARPSHNATYAFSLTMSQRSKEDAWILIQDHPEFNTKNHTRQNPLVEWTETDHMWEARLIYDRRNLNRTCRKKDCLNWCNLVFTRRSIAERHFASASHNSIVPNDRYDVNKQMQGLDEEDGLSQSARNKSVRKSSRRIAAHSDFDVFDSKQNRSNHMWEARLIYDRRNLNRTYRKKDCLNWCNLVFTRRSIAERHFASASHNSIVPNDRYDVNKQMQGLDEEDGLSQSARNKSVRKSSRRIAAHSDFDVFDSKQNRSSEEDDECSFLQRLNSMKNEAAESPESIFAQIIDLIFDESQPGTTIKQQQTNDMQKKDCLNWCNLVFTRRSIAERHFASASHNSIVPNDRYDVNKQMQGLDEEDGLSQSARNKSVRKSSRRIAAHSDFDVFDSKQNRSSEEDDECSFLQRLNSMKNEATESPESIFAQIIDLIFDESQPETKPKSISPWSLSYGNESSLNTEFDSSYNEKEDEEFIIAEKLSSMSLNVTKQPGHLPFSKKISQLVPVNLMAPPPLFGIVHVLRYVVNHNDIWADWMPDVCHMNDSKDKCVVTYGESRVRDRAYGMTGPMTIKMFRYFCKSHSHQFTFKDANPPSEVIAMLSDTPTPIVIFDRTIITRQLWDHIVSTYFEVRNFHEVSRNITLMWFRNLQDYEYKCMIVGASFSKIERDEYERSLSLTHTLVTQFVHSWYDLYGRALRIDHTFKFSKSLGVYHKGKKIQLSSYVLVVMNEDTKVLRAEIVPSVGHKDTIPVLKSIIKTPGKKMATQARFLFTDNVANDGPAVENLFRFLLKYDIKVCQDTFHIIQRICKFMPKAHPDFYAARRHMSRILKKINKGRYRTEEEIQNAFQRWIDEWSDDSLASPMSEVDMILTTADLEAGVEPRSVKRLSAVATPSAVHCVNIQMEDPVLTGLMNLIDCEYTQGTSPIENFNNVLASFQPRSQGYISLPSLKMLLQMAVFQFNLTHKDRQASWQKRKRFCMMQYLTDIHHPHVIFATANVDNWTLEKAVDMGYRTKGDSTKWYHEHEKANETHEAIADRPDIAHQNQ
ncbi:hypothetical protein PROFUN_14879 [Planoprotostelium fungivorum]|uniref:C2H2-type domain-containing protein n=1 Tax=Planoprotostelium fungivorum TaxID=1890364 RepID=A0A2P6MSB2_9EUKA|nr:hypothetical protein PROFUN_14879 [Planoprotostelium fungivorum]